MNVAGLLSSLDAKTGSEKWTTSTQGGRLIGISAKKVYLESHDDDLFIVDRGTGEILADPRIHAQRAGLKLREFTVGLTNNQNDRLYMATPSGLVISLREIGQIAPRPLRDPNQPPFGEVPPEGAMPSILGIPTIAPPAGGAAPPAEGAAPAADAVPAPANP